MISIREALARSRPVQHCEGRGDGGGAWAWPIDFYGSTAIEASVGKGLDRCDMRIQLIAAPMGESTSKEKDPAVARLTMLSTFGGSG